jgi:hypothetical protein
VGGTATPPPSFLPPWLGCRLVRATSKFVHEDHGEKAKRQHPRACLADVRTVTGQPVLARFLRTGMQMEFQMRQSPACSSRGFQEVCFEEHLVTLTLPALSKLS